MGRLGAIVAYVALNVPIYVSDKQTGRAADLMVEPVLRYAQMPLARYGWGSAQDHRTAPARALTCTLRAALGDARSAG